MALGAFSPAGQVEGHRQPGKLRSAMKASFRFDPRDVAPHCRQLKPEAPRHRHDSNSVGHMGQNLSFPERKTVKFNANSGRGMPSFWMARFHGSPHYAARSRCRRPNKCGVRSP